MPFRRCRVTPPSPTCLGLSADGSKLQNFEENGSRKARSNGSEIQCRPNCQFIHPSDPEWDRAPSATVRGRDGPPQGGRGRGQSSFGPPASGANTSTLGKGRGSSSGTWNDYMTGFDSTPRATSGARGAPSHRSGQTRQETSGWGSSAADGPGWGSSANNSGSPLNGWSTEPGASGDQVSSSQWDTQEGGWGSSGDGWGSSGNALGSSGNGWGSGNVWGSAGTDPGPGWGETSSSDQGSKASLAMAVAKIAESNVVSGETGADGKPNVATMTTPSSQAIPSIPTPGELDTTHNEERGGDALEPSTVELCR